MSHDTDFYSWTQLQAELLRGGHVAELDITNLLDEIEAMGRREKRELESRLIILVMHLLKWQYQPNHRGPSWEATIRRQRIDIHDHLADNPSLKPTLIPTLHRAYPKARLDAMGETHLPLATFPVSCPWTIDQIMDDTLWPGDN